MARRVLCGVALLWMLAALTGFPQLIDADVLRVLAGFYFSGMLIWLVTPLVMTRAGAFGHRLHPTNVMFSVMSYIAIIGHLMMAAVFWFDGGPVVTIISGSLLFMGVAGAAVLAFFSKPWADWSFRQRESEYLARLEGRREARDESREERLDSIEAWREEQRESLDAWRERLNGGRSSGEGE